MLFTFAALILTNKQTNMKKIILTVAAVFAFGFANAQESTGGKGFGSGDIFISGSVGFHSEKTGDQKYSEFTIAPKVGFFVTENIAIGGKLGFSSSTETDFPGADIKGTVLSVGAFGRFYATPASDFSFFAELGANYATMKEEQGPLEYEANGFNIGLAPGVSYFVSSNFALEASIGLLSYDTTKPDFDGAESTDTFDLNLNLNNISLGLVYKF